MLKVIPKSSINLRTFKVHKKFTQTQPTNPLYIGDFLKVVEVLILKLSPK